MPNEHPDTVHVIISDSQWNRLRYNLIKQVFTYMYIYFRVLFCQLQQVPTEVVEKEFWRLVSTMDEDVSQIT